MCCRINFSDSEVGWQIVIEHEVCKYGTSPFERNDHGNTHGPRTFEVLSRQQCHLCNKHSQ